MQDTTPGSVLVLWFCFVRKCNSIIYRVNTSVDISGDPGSKETPKRLERWRSD